MTGRDFVYAALAQAKAQVCRHGVRTFNCRDRDETAAAHNARMTTPTDRAESAEEESDD